jgi:hypothetical protein
MGGTMSLAVKLGWAQAGRANSSSKCSSRFACRSLITLGKQYTLTSIGKVFVLHTIFHGELCVKCPDFG